MSIAKIEQAVEEIFREFCPETFIYDLLIAYERPKATITRLQKGNLNLSKVPGEIIWKKHLLFRALNSHAEKSSKAGEQAVVREEPSESYDLHVAIDQLRKSQLVTKHALRFVVVTDYHTLLAVDTKTAETLDIPIADLPKHAHFFLPWAGHEKHKSRNESEADIKAAYKMARLYDQICKDNPAIAKSDPHSLNVFLSRVLFCFFAEDTEIFPREGMFTSAIKSHTQDDGSDLNGYLDSLFDAMNQEERSHLVTYLKAFPYVNGGLFQTKLKSPMFSRQSRKLLLECGDLNWSEINPDIFGSMMQGVVHTEQRGEIGMHYTSVSNIMKVIEPLFLNDLRETFEENRDSIRGLEKLRTRLSKIRVFDPACGSGNFLVIAFKELRKLEIDIYLRLCELNPNYQTLFTMPQIQLVQFHGIELDDFAHEIATLSLWLAEHQMNVRYKQKLKIFVPALPLKPSGHIICANATRLDWTEVCQKLNDAEVFVLGNPPYLGSSNQSEAQKEDMTEAFKGLTNFKNLDYISCWFLKGAEYIKDWNAKLGFVTTNSICQGEQVEMLWPHLFGRNLEIAFAYKPFHWSNSAKHNAGVTVAIVGLRNNSGTGKKPLFSGTSVQIVDNISPYLFSGNNTIVRKRPKPANQELAEMVYGSKPVDDGNLFLADDDRQKLLSQAPQAAKFIKKVLGSNEFIKGLQRWCIWVDDQHVEEAQSIKPLRDRFEKVRQFRLNSVKAATQADAAFPYKFGEPRYVRCNSIIIPRVSSEARQYIPIGFLDEDTVITDLAFAIYSTEPWIFSLICSRMHNVWVRAVSGRMRTDIRYSNVLCYNTFPFPIISDKQRETLATHAFNILSEREKNSERTIAQLYHIESMPAGLLKAHKDLDLAVERLYRSKAFTTDDDRLQYLFRLYEEMTVQVPKETAGAQV